MPTVKETLLQELEGVEKELANQPQVPKSSKRRRAREGGREQGALATEITATLSNNADSPNEREADNGPDDGEGTVIIHILFERDQELERKKLDIQSYISMFKYETKLPFHIS